MKAAGGALTAKQAPRRPGTAPALGLRAGEMSPPFYRRPTWKGRTNHVIPQLAAGPPIRPGAGLGPTPAPATRLEASRVASAKPRSPGRPSHTQLHLHQFALGPVPLPGGVGAAATAIGRLHQR